MRGESIIPAGVDDSVPATSAGLRIAGVVATVAALALLALAVAYWAWQAVAPPRVHVPAATPADPGAALLASGLFAGPPAGTQPTNADAAPQVLGGDVRLLGVFAEPNGRGYALFRMASGPRLVAAGKEIAPGATLAEVRPDGIRVRESGGDRSIELRPMAARPAAGAIGASAPKTASGAAAARSACAPPPGFKGDVIALNAELMGGLIAQPESWRALVEPVGGALVVRDESGFSAMLGLKRGDRITQANGIALTAPDDVIGAVLRPLAAKQTVRIAGSRDGRARELWLRNVTC